MNARFPFSRHQAAETLYLAPFFSRRANFAADCAENFAKETFVVGPLSHFFANNATIFERERITIVRYIVFRVPVCR